MARFILGVLSNDLIENNTNKHTKQQRQTRSSNWIHTVNIEQLHYLKLQWVLFINTLTYRDVDVHGREGGREKEIQGTEWQSRMHKI